MLLPFGYSMKIFLVNFKTFETNLIVLLKFENIVFSIKVGSGRLFSSFISQIHDRFGANHKLSLW